MVVTKQELRRIIQEAVRRKLDAVGPNARVRIPRSVKLEGRLTQEQLQGLIDEEFALALALRFPLAEDTEDRQERMHRDLDGDDEEGESAEHRKAVLGHQDETTSYLDEDLFDYASKGSHKPVVSSGDKWKKAMASVNMLKATAEKLEHAALDDDEQGFAKLLDRVKQFTKAAESSLYGAN
jgi:hypothetical protein